MSLKPKEVSEQLSYRQWSSVCHTVDMKYGHGAKFDVVSIKAEKGKILVLVCATGGALHMIELLVAA